MLLHFGCFSLVIQLGQTRTTLLAVWFNSDWRICVSPRPLVSSMERSGVGDILCLTGSTSSDGAGGGGGGGGMEGGGAKVLALGSTCSNFWREIQIRIRIFSHLKPSGRRRRQRGGRRRTSGSRSWTRRAPSPSSCARGATTTRQGGTAHICMSSALMCVSGG